MSAVLQSVPPPDETIGIDHADGPGCLARAHDLVHSVLIPAEHRLEGLERMPEDLTEALRQAGLFCLSIPRCYGGLGLTMEAQILVMLEVTRASAAFRSRFSTTIGLGSQPICYVATEAQRSAWLPGMASGSITAAFALTEPEYGSDASAIGTTATRDCGGYVISGTKRYITNAPEAGVFVVIARTDPASRDARGLSAFIVPVDTEGLAVGPFDPKMGQDAAPTSEVHFASCRVPASSLIGGKEGGGLETAMRGINHARLHVAATCVGQAERLIAESLSYTMSRVQFGVPIASHQAAQIMLADSRAEAFAARAMVLEAARHFDRLGATKEVIEEIACCKLFASEMATRVADRAVQMHGAAGYMRGTAVERLYRDVRLFRIFEGTSQIQQILIARGMIGRHQRV